MAEPSPTDPRIASDRQVLVTCGTAGVLLVAGAMALGFNTHGDDFQWLQLAWRACLWIGLPLVALVGAARTGRRRAAVLAACAGWLVVALVFKVGNLRSPDVVQLAWLLLPVVLSSCAACLGVGLGPHRRPSGANREAEPHRQLRSRRAHADGETTERPHRYGRDDGDPRTT